MAEGGRNKLTVAAIGDLHVRQERTGVLRELFAEMSKAADVLVLCGDLTDVGNPGEAEALAEDIRACSIPVVGVLGNHDYESGHVEEVAKILRDGGLHLLDGQSCEIEDVGFVGSIERVDADLLQRVAERYIPVIASVGPDRDGQPHNVNADEAAAAVARALGAHKVIFLTDVDGWLRDPADPQSVISEASADDVQAALPQVAGGMRPKLQACLDAIHGGVGYAHIIDGRVPHSLLLELFTDAGIGTKVRPAA